MQLQLVHPWFILRGSRSGLQVETNPLSYGHLPSDNLAEDALNRNFIQDRAQMVAHCKPLSSCSARDFWCFVSIWPSSFSPYHNLAMCAPTCGRSRPATLRWTCPIRTATSSRWIEQFTRPIARGQFKFVCNCFDCGTSDNFPMWPAACPIT